MKHCCSRRNELHWLFAIICQAICLWILIPAGVRADSTPSILWEQIFPNGGGANSVAVGLDGHPVVTGDDCPGEPNPSTCVARTTKYDGTTGVVLWTVTTTFNGSGGGVAVGADGNPVIVVGVNDGTNFNYSIRTIKYDGATGAQLWEILPTGAFSFGVAIGADGNPVVTGRLGPNGGGWRTIKYSSSASVSGCNPAVGALSSVPAAVGGSLLIAVGSSVSFSAPWTDRNVTATHTAVCDIVDVSGATAATVVVGAAPGSGSGTASCDVIFGSTGIFSVTLTVTDQGGASATSSAIQVVVYDPSAGFVTGGGWFTPDPQTCVCTPGSKATFGLVSKYQKGSSVPTGNQEFQYKADNINLHSTGFDWLVVSGPQAQFQGTGTINGSGAFKFRVTVRDGGLIGQPDRFEIRILPAGSTDFGGMHLWKGGNDLTGSDGAGSIVIHH